MKIKVYIKDPDGFYESVNEAVNEFVKDIAVSTREKELIVHERTENVWNTLSKFVNHQECVTLEFDTETGTAVVLPR